VSSDLFRQQRSLFCQPDLERLAPSPELQRLVLRDLSGPAGQVSQTSNSTAAHRKSWRVQPLVVGLIPAQRSAAGMKSGSADRVLDEMTEQSEVVGIPHSLGSVAVGTVG